jgi:hypothetical protein
MEDEVERKMKARVPNQTTMQQMIDAAVSQAQTNAIKLCVVTGIAADVDCGFAESTLQKKYKKWKSYIDSVRSGNVTWEEIAQTLEEENGITFDWMDGEPS